MERVFDVIVIGGGAAGLMCAAVAGQRGRKVAVLEGSAAPGRKILISGGGRCNFTNLYTRPENFLSQNPHFAKSALARYSPGDFIALVDRYRIPWHEKKLGQLFCDRSAREILDLLLNECRAGGVEVVTGCRVGEVRKYDGFQVETSKGIFTAPVLVVASGGLSIPKAGATPRGYELARQFGLRVVPPRPALVPLLFDGEARTQWCDLAGVAADSIAKFNGQSFRERFLITHKGLSGPAILQISSYWDGKSPITLDLQPDDEAQLPRRFADRWYSLHDPGEIHEWRIKPAGTEGFEKAEVTAGGVDTNELSSKTMESRKVPGLYFIGEVVDVTGHLGGFNFQWAWASAQAAGQSL